jgi:hypothetical protein
MGIDTRYWGPSAWQLFHLIAFFSPDPQDTLLDIKDILPCKFCRASTTEYTAEMPTSSCKDPGRWMYELHNRVNEKLRTQAKTDPMVLSPEPNPSFEDVKSRYERMYQAPPATVPGRDFLMSIAVNYGDKTPIDCDIEAIHKTFWVRMALVYPFEDLRAIVARYGTPTSALKSRSAYSRWVYGLLKRLSSKVKSPIPTYARYVQHVMYYKSGCNRKTFRGKTCRRGGRHAKTRKHFRLRQIHNGLGRQ